MNPPRVLNEDTSGRRGFDHMGEGFITFLVSMSGDGGMEQLPTGLSDVSNTGSPYHNVIPGMYLRGCLSSSGWCNHGVLRVGVLLCDVHPAELRDVKPAPRDVRCIPGERQ